MVHTKDLEEEDLIGNDFDIFVLNLRLSMWNLWFD